MELKKYVPESFLSKKSEVVFAQGPAGGGGELHVEGFGHLVPRDLLWHGEWHTAWLRESIVPSNGSPGVWLLVAMDDHHYWQRQRPHLHTTHILDNF